MRKAISKLWPAKSLPSVRKAFAGMVILSSAVWTLAIDFNVGNLVMLVQLATDPAVAARKGKRWQGGLGINAHRRTNDKARCCLAAWPGFSKLVVET